MTKRQAITQIPAEDLRLVAQAAGDGVNNKLYSPGETRRIKRAAKVLAQIQTGKKE